VRMKGDIYCLCDDKERNKKKSHTFSAIEHTGSAHALQIVVAVGNFRIFSVWFPQVSLCSNQNSVITGNQCSLGYVTLRYVLEPTINCDSSSSSLQ
jgi:hypothetical protein